ncbi:ABC transporter substrate-binding protein [Telmatospirillum siberiense]|nr:ABC transporter substrate-binding protein [Telmatospirillum siberiense]
MASPIGSVSSSRGISITLLFLVAGFWSVSAMSATQTTTPKSGGQVTFGVTTEPVCFNPQRSEQQNSFILSRNLVDSLLAKDVSGRFLPWLAREWTVSADGRIYVFKLREGVTFHDGTPLDAEAVKFNLDFVRDKANTNAAGQLLQAVEHVEATASHEVTLHLAKPDSALLESLASIRLGILSPKSLQSGDRLCSGGPALAGSGPFKFESYVRGQSASFVRNDAYNWAPGYAAHQGPAYLDRLIVRFLPEYSVRAGALSSGQVDVIEGIQPTDIGLFKDQPGFQFIIGPSGAQTSFTLNVNYTIPPATDIRVRRALRDGADIAALVDSVYLGTVRRAWSNIAPDNPFYDKSLDGSWGKNVEQANRLLDEAGWTGRDSEGFRTRDGQRLAIEVGYPQPFVRDNRDILIQGLQAQLRKNLGFDLRLRFITGGEWAQQKEKGNWTIYPNTYLPADAAQELSANIGEQGFIRGVADKGDKELFRLINDALQATSQDEKTRLVRAAQRRAVDQAFIVPLFSANYQLAARDTVHGLSFETQLDSPSNFHDVWLTAK